MGPLRRIRCETSEGHVMIFGMQERIDPRQEPSRIGVAATALQTLYRAIWATLYDHDSFGPAEFYGCEEASSKLFGVLDEDDPVQTLKVRLAALPDKLRRVSGLAAAEEKAMRAVEALAITS